MSLISDPDELPLLFSQIMEHYNNGSEFFAEYELPEYKSMRSLNLDGRNLALFLTFGSVTNHIHNETKDSKKTDGDDGLWSVSERLWRDHTWLFRPEELVGENQRDRLKTVLGNEEIMDGRDPKWWYANAETLYKNYDSDPRQLLAENDYVAPNIGTAVQGYGFKGFGGTGKIRSLWLRLMHEEIHELDRIREISIPADIHIVLLTNRFGGTDYDPDNPEDLDCVKNYWDVFCTRHDFIPVKIDKPLWLLHKYWNPDGHQYIATQLEAIRA